MDLFAGMPVRDLEKAREWYSRVLRYFGDYLEEQGHSTNLGDLDLEVVRGFVLYNLRSQSPHTLEMKRP